MSEKNKEEYLFVYGSLQSEARHSAHNVLAEHSDLICEAEFEGELYLVEEYPGVISTADSTNHVKGELYKLHQPRRVLPKLDRYEGYYPNNPAHSLYLREKREVCCRSGDRKKVTAWIYLYNGSTHNLQRIESGDYLSFIRNSR